MVFEIAHSSFPLVGAASRKNGALAPFFLPYPSCAGGPVWCNRAMDKSEILADLRKQFGPGAYLYAKDIAVVLNMPSVGAVYEHIKRNGGLPWPIKWIGKRPAVSIYAVASSMAGEDMPVAKAKEPVPGKPVLPAPKHKVNKELTKALSLLRAQQQFIDQVCAEIEALVLVNEIADKRKGEKAEPEKPEPTTKKRV